MSRGTKLLIGLLLSCGTTACQGESDDGAGPSDGAGDTPTSSGSPSSGESSGEDCVTPPVCGDACPVDGECCPCWLVEPYCATDPDGRSAIVFCQQYGMDAAFAGGSCYELEPCEEGSSCLPGRDGTVRCEPP